MARGAKKNPARDTSANKIAYGDIPEPIRAWMERTGAEQLNHRRYMIRQHIERETKDGVGGGSYYRERSLLTIDKERKVHFYGEPEHEPSADERKAMEAALVDAKYPTSAPGSVASAEALRKRLGVSEDNWWVLLANNRRDVIMCQERRDKETGMKDYFPWTYFSDGEWRMMEPDSALPFWKPAKKSGSGKIMIHEGCKAARYVDWLCHSDDPEAKALRETHPWYSELKWYEHWGITGGALAPHRADYSELHAAKPKEVCYVCDNDRPGEAALQVVAANYRKALVGVRFDGRFKEGWDLADPIPEKLYKRGVYTGPAFYDLTTAGTWATELVAVPHSKKRVAVLTPDFKEEWFHSITPTAYVNKRWPHIIYYGDENFNNRVAPFAHVRQIALLMQKDDAGKAVQLTYDPTKAQGLVSMVPRSFNTYRPPTVKAEKGDDAPWREYLAHLIPDPEERTEILRWCATLVECPHIKMKYGLLLCSEMQGVGKTTLGHILQALIGDHNVSRPGELEIIDNNFTTWQDNCRLIVVDEIYSGHSFTAYNRLKSLITDPTLKIHRKFQEPYVIPNWVHMIASSNSMAPLKISEEDRRWYVPKVTEKKASKAFWKSFHEWLSIDGPAIIKWSLQQFLKKHEAVDVGSDAPGSKAKRIMIEEGRSAEERAAADIIERLAEDLGEEDIVITTDAALWDYILHTHYQGRQPADGKGWRLRPLRRIARTAGWGVSEERVFVGREYPKGHLITYPADLATLDPSTFWQRITKAVGIGNDGAEWGTVWAKFRASAPSAGTKAAPRGGKGGSPKKRILLTLQDFGING